MSWWTIGGWATRSSPPTTTSSSSQTWNNAHSQVRGQLLILSAIDATNFNFPEMTSTDFFSPSVLTYVRPHVRYYNKLLDPKKLHKQ